MKQDKCNVFDITKAWFAFVAENADLKPIHTTVFLYSMNVNNILGWKEVFGLPSLEAAESLNISPATFRKAIDDLCEKKVIKMVKKSKNQYTASQVSMRVAFKNLLQQKSSNYLAFVKAQQQQLISNLHIVLHNNNNTLLHDYNKKEEQNKILQNSNENLKIEIENLKKELDLKKQDDEEEKKVPQKKEKRIWNKEEKLFLKELTVFFPERILARLTPNEKEGWAIAIDELQRIDKYTKEQILLATKTGREDGFLKKNFLALPKLRRKDVQKIKYIEIYLAAAEKSTKINKNNNYSNNYSQETDEEYKNRMLEEIFGGDNTNAPELARNALTIQI